jgi:hypothetical protein
MRKQILTIVAAITCLSGFASSALASSHKSGGHHSASGNHSSLAGGHGGHSSKGGKSGGGKGGSGIDADKIIGLVQDIINR